VCMTRLIQRAELRKTSQLTAAERDSQLPARSCRTFTGARVQSRLRADKQRSWSTAVDNAKRKASCPDRWADCARLCSAVDKMQG